MKLFSLSTYYFVDATETILYYSQMDKKIPPIERFIDYFGNMNLAAQAVGKSRQGIHLWRTQGWIPFAQGEIVERVTNGAITKQEVWEAAAKARHHASGIDH